MKIVIAMDSFKGSLKAVEACQIIADALSDSLPDAQIVTKPMADGGEGTAEAMLKAAGGTWIPQTVMGPLPDMKVEAGFAWFDNDRSALVEMASASGLELLTEEQMYPLSTTTYGTGQLIKAASEHGAERIMLAVGGSATVDGGVGAAIALGWRFLDDIGLEVSFDGRGLGEIMTICEPANLKLPPVQVLCDVENPLCGPNGAARIYGPQKGATPDMVEKLEAGLAHLAELVRANFGRDIENVPGAGAAGGLSAGAIAFMNAELVSGVETIIACCDLKAELESADWVITGEGSFDQQSLSGKVVSGIIDAASESNTRVAVLAGRVNLPEDQWRDAGITAAIATAPPDMPLSDAIRDCRNLLQLATERFARQHMDT